MKRAFTLILMVLAGALLLAPFGLVQTDHKLSVGTNNAWSASAPGSEGGGGGSSDPFIRKDDKCGTGVGIALPIFGTANCVNNSAGSGGAVINYLKTVLQLLSIAVGMVIILMLVIAGIQYISSFGDPGMIKGAKNRVINAITGLMLYLLMFAILSFLVPGGIF